MIGNKAEKGGAIRSEESILKFENSIFKNNSAVYGGVIDIQGKEIITFNISAESRGNNFSFQIILLKSEEWLPCPPILDLS